MSDKNKFRDLLKAMDKEFPFIDSIGLEHIIPDVKTRKELIRQKIIVKVDWKDNLNRYMLSINGLILANAWKTEELTNKVKKLTWVLVVLTGVLAFLTFLLYVKP